MQKNNDRYLSLFIQHNILSIQMSSHGIHTKIESRMNGCIDVCKKYHPSTIPHIDHWIQKKFAQSLVRLPRVLKMIRTTRSRVFFLHVSTLQHRSWICLYMCIAIAHIDCSEAAPNNIATTLGATTTAPLAMFATRQNIDADTDDKVRATVTDTKLVPQFAALSRHTLSLGGNIRVDNVTRLHGGDVFQAYGKLSHNILRRVSATKNHYSGLYTFDWKYSFTEHWFQSE